MLDGDLAPTCPVIVLDAEGQYGDLVTIDLDMRRPPVSFPTTWSVSVTVGWPTGAPSAKRKRCSTVATYSTTSKWRVAPTLSRPTSW